MAGLPPGCGAIRATALVSPFTRIRARVISTAAQRRPSARRTRIFFLRSIDESLKWIDSYGRYNNDQQREDVRELFRRGREVFAGLAG